MKFFAKLKALCAKFCAWAKANKVTAICLAVAIVCVLACAIAIPLSVAGANKAAEARRTAAKESSAEQSGKTADGGEEAANPADGGAEATNPAGGETADPTASLKEGLIGSIKEGIFNSCLPENATYSVVFRREDYSQVEGFRALRDGASFEVHRDRKIYVSDGKVCYEITNKGSTQVNKKFNDAGVAEELGFANTHLKDLPDGAHPTESCTWVADEGVWRYELENEDGKLTAYFVYNAVADFITVQRYRLEYGTEGEPSYIYEVTLTDRGETEPMSVNDL